MIPIILTLDQLSPVDPLPEHNAPLYHCPKCESPMAVTSETENGVFILECEKCGVVVHVVG